MAASETSPSNFDSDIDYRTNPALKPLAGKLAELHRQVFVVDSYLRRFGLGYLCVNDRWFEYFEAALGLQDGETPEEARQALTELDSQLGKLHELLQAANQLKSGLLPKLPRQALRSVRSEQVMHAVAQASVLCKHIAERCAAVHRKYSPAV